MKGACAEAHLDAIRRAGVEQRHFSWRGPVNDPRRPFYYRVHGPRLIIEFAVPEPDHIPTIMREPQTIAARRTTRNMEPTLKPAE